jgi:hypothetical protein
VERDATAAARRALLGALIDHAPLFPPASLPLDQALEDHRQARSSQEAWMVARFVAPASRLVDVTDPSLRLTVVVDAPVDPAQLDDRVEAVEGPLPAADLAAFRRQAFAELSLDDATEEQLPEVAAVGIGAKVRCGPHPPPIERLAAFVRGCREHGVPFKATAGLHHAIRTRGQHGFLNLLAAAVFGDEERALQEADADAFRLNGRFSWRDREAGPEVIQHVRRALFTTFGSCSFDEPVDDLKARGLL